MYSVALSFRGLTPPSVVFRAFGAFPRTAIILYLQALKFVTLLRKSPVSCKGKTRVRMIL